LKLHPPGSRAAAGKAQKNPMDDVVMKINTEMNMAFKGAFDVKSEDAQKKTEEIAGQIIEGNPTLATQKRPDETYLGFVNRMLGANIPAGSAPASPAAQATPPPAPSGVGAANIAGQVPLE
jgi:hypothetical protein